MGRFSSKTCRLGTMIVLTTSFFLVEIIVGYMTNSVALIADSFHMLSDVIALFVGLAAVKMSTKTTSKNTYGWQRAEVLGALVNAVFLIALCFTIVVQAVQRFIDKQEVDDPKLVLIVGSVGLLVNGIGLCLFSTHGMGHGHSHGGGHGHSHGRGTKKPTKASSKMQKEFISSTHVKYSKVEDENDTSHKQPNGFAYVEIGDYSVDDANKLSLSGNGSDESGVQLTDETTGSSVDHDSVHVEQIDSTGQLNMRGVFLHVLGDALGSVVVIISALIIWFTTVSWKSYVDPALSLIIVLIIVGTTLPLFKQSSMILLQSLPTDVDVEDIEERLKDQVIGIENIHELHIWQLSSDKIIATAHIRFSSIQHYVRAAKLIKSFLHDEGIHSTTIQPEFSDDMTDGAIDVEESCMLKCVPQDCRTMTCCDNQTRRRKSQPDSDGKKKSEKSPKSSSVWSRFARRSSMPNVPVDSSKQPLLQNVESPPVDDTAMGTTEVKSTKSFGEKNVY